MASAPTRPLSLVVLTSMGRAPLTAVNAMNIVVFEGQAAGTGYRATGGQSGRESGAFAGFVGGVLGGDVTAGALGPGEIRRDDSAHEGHAQDGLR